MKEWAATCSSSFMSSKTLVGLFLAALLAGCSSGASPALVVGDDGAGGASSGILGNGGALVLIADASAKTLSAHVESPPGMTVSFVRLSCSNACADVLVVAQGGFPPYTYGWDDGSTDRSREICPKTTTAYLVSVTDSGSTSGEFARKPRTVTAPLTASVTQCPLDGGASDGGGVLACDEAGTIALPAGKYTGNWTAEGTTSNFPDAGPLNFVVTSVVGNPSDGFLAFDATVDFLYGPPPGTLITIHATFTGELACNGAVTAVSHDATWSTLGTPLGTGQITLTGTFDPAAVALAGSLTMASAVIGGTANGTWNGTLSP